MKTTQTLNEIEPFGREIKNFMDRPSPLELVYNTCGRTPLNKLTVDELNWMMATVFKHGLNVLLKRQEILEGIAEAIQELLPNLQSLPILMKVMSSMAVIMENVEYEDNPNLRNLINACGNKWVEFDRARNAAAAAVAGGAAAAPSASAAAAQPRLSFSASAPSAAGSAVAMPANNANANPGSSKEPSRKFGPAS